MRGCRNRPLQKSSNFTVRERTKETKFKRVRKEIKDNNNGKRFDDFKEK